MRAVVRVVVLVLEAGLTKKVGMVTEELFEPIEDLGTPELRQHVIFTEIKTEKGRRQTRVDVQVPLDYYKLRRWITPQQYHAGDLFYKKWRSGAVKSHYSQMRYASEYTPAVDYADRTAEEARIIMEWEYKAARNALPSVEVKAIMFRVCCLGEWARDAKTNPAQKIETTMKLLRRGLDSLIEHFGL